MAQKNGKPKSQLSPELRREIVELVIETYHKEQEKERKARRDNRLHNTKLLMEKYRGFVIHSESAVYDAAHVQDDNLHELIDLMECRDAVVVESVRESAARTSIMVHHIDRMLRFYEYCCNSSRKPEDARRLRVIKALYIDEDRKTIDEIAAAEHVDTRTIYRDHNAALQELSALLFGYFE